MLTDALGSVYGLADDSAVRRARYGYDVYGLRTASLEEIATRWGFTGASFLPQEPRFSVLRLRYLDSTVGGFVALDVDPERRDGPNLYEYVRNNPIRLRDPLGLFALFLDPSSCAGSGGRIEQDLAVGRARINAVRVANSGRRLVWRSYAPDGTLEWGEFAFDGLTYPPTIGSCRCNGPGGLCGLYTGVLAGDWGKVGTFDLYLPEAETCDYSLPTVVVLGLMMLHEWTHAAIDIVPWMKQPIAKKVVGVQGPHGYGFPVPASEWVARYAEVIAEDVPLKYGFSQ